MYKQIPIIDAEDSQLIEISKSNMLSLDICEMSAIRDYFREIGRNPTDCEIETLAQTWSEHCCHKTFKADIEYTESNNGSEVKENINLFKEIFSVTSCLNKDWCLSVFKDNAGIVRFNSDFGIAFKVETHNHPSALEPYGGAGTGIGGVIRDILGVGKGAKPILNTDVFCLGRQEISYKVLPEGVLHPKKVFKGVVSGVRDYGNRMGIPTANGTIIFDKSFQNNPLIFCGTAGIIPIDRIEKQVMPGDCIVVAGGKTGRDGIHGATFSSVSLEKDISTSVVQIGNPIVEKKLLDALMAVREKNLYNFITDCGAGGLSSAVGEMAQETGARVNLDAVPLKYPGLMPWEIWVSESQERMVLAVPAENVDELLEIFSCEDVDAHVIGLFEDTGLLRLYSDSQIVCELDMHFLHEGIPIRKLNASFNFVDSLEVKAPAGKTTDWAGRVLMLLGSCNIASKEKVITQYDHEVQGHTILKPHTGMEVCGPNDAVVLKPLYNGNEGVVFSCGINPFYGVVDPYFMAGCCIDEALRNIVAVGGDPERVAVLDNFCWGDVGSSSELGSLVRCVKGCRDFALAYGVPFISGKDSLNNYFVEKSGRSTSIPGTLLISAVGMVPDACNVISSGFKSGGNPVYICGKTMDEMGGSRYYNEFSFTGGRVPEPRPAETMGLMKKIYIGISEGSIISCHDCSDGGFITALAEMVMGGKGAHIRLEAIGGESCNVESLLFSETQGRFIVEVEKDCNDRFLKLMEGQEVFFIGSVNEEEFLRVDHMNEPLFALEREKLSLSWRSGIKW